MKSNVNPENPYHSKKVAILKADLYDDSPQKKDKIESLYLQFFQQSNYKLAFFNVIHNQFPDPAEYDLYLITGSRHSVYEPMSWITNLEDFINNNKLPKLIGICFGHQLIAKARGGKVENCGWHVGIKPVTFYSSSNRLYSYRFNHQDHVVVPPKNAAILASSPDCQYAMIQQDAHTLGMQFHPEFTFDHHKEVINRIKNDNGFSPAQYQIFQKDIIGEVDTQKALQVIQTFLNF